MCRARLCLLLLFAVTSLQAQMPDTVISGLYGVPRLVRDEANNWVEPIRVYGDTSETIYIPDITHAGWAQWHSKEFKEKGTYFTYVYTYLHKQRETVRETIYVDTRTQQVLAVPFLQAPVHINLRDSPKISQITTAITKIVQDGVNNFNGPDIQAVEGQQRRALGRLFLCNNPQAPPSPDCNLSDEEFQKKHPSYAAGAPPITDSKRVSPPTLIYSVEPQYPAEARAMKTGGTVTVNMIVDTQGIPQNLQIVKSRGAALDQSALNAVAQYRFKPARDATGTPVTMPMNIDVQFQIF